MYENLVLTAATLIGLSGVAVIVGVILIRRGNRVWHPRVMLSATTLAVLFLVLYVVRWAWDPYLRRAGGVA